MHAFADADPITPDATPRRGRARRRTRGPGPRATLAASEQALHLAAHGFRFVRPVN